MRRPSLTTKTDRHRDEAAPEAHYRDEPHLHDPVPASVHVLSGSVQGSTQHDEHHLHRNPALAPHVVSVDAPNAPMTAAFPADDATAIANHTSTTVSVGPSANSTNPQGHGDDVDNHQHLDIGHPDSDIDLDLDLPVHHHESSRPPLPDDLTLPPIFNPDLTPSYHHHEDYDLDMSDSDDGGAPIDSIIAAATNLVSPVPQLHFQDHHPAPPDEHDEHEDDDDQESAPGSLNYLHPLFHLPTFASAGLVMDAPPLPPGWGASNIANAPPQNQQMDAPEDVPMVSNPNPTMLGSENLSFFDFLRHWAIQSRSSSSMSAARLRPPCIQSIRHQAANGPEEVRYSDLRGDACDIQGIDWYAMGTTRREARERRSLTYRNYTNHGGSDKWTPHLPDVKIPSRDSFFRFRGLHVRRDVYLAHFQLRSVLACPSRTQAFYPGPRGINRINPVSRKTELALNLSGVSGLGSVISTLDANHGVLMAGTFNGEYCLKNLDSENKRNYTDGQITNNPSGITNHLKIHLPRRSSGPAAALASNDNGFRIMDLTTEKFVSETMYPFALNCSAMSPDGRLRVMVGDHFNVMIADADTGQIQKELTGHRDFGFSCDWSDDGWTIATGCQDKGVKIWDARRWCDINGRSMPLCTIRSEMAGVRSLRFSPVGSGQKVLVAAEEADFVNIIDAQTFNSKQTIDIFGEIGGVAFSNDGQDLNVLCSDHNRGGLLQLERCGRSAEPFFNDTWRRQPSAWRWHNELDNHTDAGKPFHRRHTMLDSVPMF